MTLNRWLPGLFDRFLRSGGGVKAALFPPPRPKRRRRGSERVAAVAAIIEKLEDRTLLAAPVAYDQSPSTVHDQPLSGGVMASDFDGDPLTYHESAGPSNGQLQFNSNGSFTYTPATLYTGSDSFSWYASGGGENSNIATVYIDVTNGAPTAYDQSPSTLHDQPLSGGVMASDFDGDPLTYHESAGPSNGQLQFNSNGSFTYTPASLFTGSDSFTWFASDGIANSNVATVYIDVTNGAPTAYDQSPSTLHDQPLSGGVMASDFDGDPLTYHESAGPSNGQLQFNSNGSYTYTPGPLFTGSDSFTWYATDGIDDSNVATVTIDVTNTAPVSFDQSQSTPHGQTLYGGVMANDYDGDPLVYSLAFGPSNGAVDFHGDGSFTYMPNAGFTGTDGFTWWASDGIDDSNLATVTINVDSSGSNSAPIAYADGGYAVVNTVSLTAMAENGVLANDFDPDGDPLSAVLYSSPAHGTVSLASDGSFTYTPSDEFEGWDNFEYRAFDGIDYSEPVAVALSRNRFYIQTGDLVSNDADINDPSKYVNIHEVTSSTITERWIGELVHLRAAAAGPAPPEAVLSWSVPAAPVLGINFGDAVVYNGQTLFKSAQLESFTSPSGGNPVNFYWLNSTWPPLAVNTVSLTVSVAGMAPVQLSTKFRVKAPQVSVLVNTGTITSETFLFATAYRVGSADPAIPSGIQIDTTVVDGPAGTTGFVQLVTSTDIRAFFADDPNRDVPFANPSVGAGDYIITTRGIDASVSGSTFTDSPQIAVPVSGAGETAIVNAEMDFETYVMWKSDRPGSLPAAVRLVSWKYWFRAFAANVGGTWKWGGPDTTSYIDYNVSDPGVSQPEWDSVADPGTPPWIPLG